MLYLFCVFDSDFRNFTVCVDIVLQACEVLLALRGNFVLVFIWHFFTDARISHTHLSLWSLFWYMGSNACFVALEIWYYYILFSHHFNVTHILHSSCVCKCEINWGSECREKVWKGLLLLVNPMWRTKTEQKVMNVRDATIHQINTVTICTLCLSVSLIIKCADTIFETFRSL